MSSEKPCPTKDAKQAENDCDDLINKRFNIN